jgi:hypothetical protein
MKQLLEGINSLRAIVSRIFNYETINSNNRVEFHFHTVNFISGRTKGIDNKIRSTISELLNNTKDQCTVSKKI